MFLIEMYKSDPISSERGQGGMSLCMLLHARSKEDKTSQGKQKEGLHHCHNHDYLTTMLSLL